MDGRYHHSVLFINKVNASQKADIFDDEWEYTTVMYSES